MGIHANMNGMTFNLNLLELINLIYILSTVAFCLGGYVLQSLALCSIARRRCIKHPWLAWIPLGDVWILGSVSDQYRYVVKRQICNKRKVMLWLSVAAVAVTLLMVALLVGVIVSTIDFGLGYQNTSRLAVDLVGGLFGIGAAVIVICGLSVAMMVFRCICLYDLYRSCEPSKKILYLLLSIFLAFLQPVFMFLCRNKELGMPPRKVVAAQPQNQE